MASKILKAVLNKLIGKGVIYPSNHMRLPNLIRMGWKAHERGKVKDAIIHEGIPKGLLMYVKRGKKAIAIPRSRLSDVKKLLYGEDSRSPTILANKSIEDGRKKIKFKNVLFKNSWSISNK